MNCFIFRHIIFTHEKSKRELKLNRESVEKIKSIIGLTNFMLKIITFVFVLFHFIILLVRVWKYLIYNIFFYFAVVRLCGLTDFKWKMTEWLKVVLWNETNGYSNRLIWSLITTVDILLRCLRKDTKEICQSCRNHIKMIWFCVEIYTFLQCDLFIPLFFKIKSKIFCGIKAMICNYLALNTTHFIADIKIMWVFWYSWKIASESSIILKVVRQKVRSNRRCAREF